MNFRIVSNSWGRTLRELSIRNTRSTGPDWHLCSETVARHNGNKAQVVFFFHLDRMEKVAALPVGKWYSNHLPDKSKILILSLSKYHDSIVPRVTWEYWSQKNIVWYLLHNVFRYYCPQISQYHGYHRIVILLSRYPDIIVVIRKRIFLRSYRDNIMCGRPLLAHMWTFQTNRK